MDLKSYLKSLGSDEAREAFATGCGTTPGHLANVAYGKTCGPQLAVALEQQTKCALRRWDLRPDDWHLIWPELTKVKGCPAIPAAPAKAVA